MSLSQVFDNDFTSDSAFHIASADSQKSNEKGIESPIENTTSAKSISDEEQPDFESKDSSPYHSEDHKPSFNYDLEIFNLCKEYLNTKNHHGLALIARQKGIPPFLRFKVWPILLKYHPFVLDPFIQPDNEIINESSDVESTSSKETSSSSLSSLSSKGYFSQSESEYETRPESRKDSDASTEIERKIKKDISRYIQRLYYLKSHDLTATEKEIIHTLECAVLKFTLKWAKIIKYDTSLCWMALNLAEWFPPLPRTPWVLVGRDHSQKGSSLIASVVDDYSNYIDHIPGLDKYLDELIYKNETISNMKFQDVYERLVLVLLHCPEPKTNMAVDGEVPHSSDQKDERKQLKVNKTTLPITGGTIEQRVSFFIFCLRKLLPELAQHFHEEQILSKFGCSDDEWLIWWLKFCGTKVWSKHDRGRIWDYLLGWRLKNPKRSFNYYYEKLNYVNRNTLQKLGPDVFWTVGSAENEKPNVDLRRNSFRDLINELNNELHISKSDLSSASSPKSPNKSKGDNNQPNLAIPFSRIDPHISLIFISISLLKSKENTLVELDQHEIRQFLSRLPSKSYKYNQKSRKRSNQSMNSSSNSRNGSPPLPPNEEAPTSSIIISNDMRNDKHKINFIDNIISEAGELWRKWLWSEFVEDS
ncbi:OCA5 [Candida theae]|uniref:Oxidant-induced cell-cycle arrest protein 5 n=1 Tax=Candida theae TaxID=1198502 RepID=A0AAD5BGD2_9ASCO|nr:OCA5 [Candida theae]KAI5961467.1 OCA5 [Candida theae]